MERENNAHLTSTSSNDGEEGTVFSDGDYSDQDPDYNPKNTNRTSGSSNESSSEDENHPENANPVDGQIGKKRLRRISLWKRERAKRLRNRGEMYVDRKQKVHPPKGLRECVHQCRYHCNRNISEERRQVIFNDFWELGSWELQTSFLNGAIVLEPVKRKTATAVSNKAISCVYKLNGFRVCKDFFLKTVDVTNKRLQNLVSKKKNLPSGVAPRDRRGKKEPGNKIGILVIIRGKGRFNKNI